ncbi:hypothetical protein JK358_27200 [Nocardia sp. 2]|uniref:Secreted protein n=1 Tax=Nocardia acididurans TaxID=2802282 RepID=A0ABS1MFW1_9NOCA|nr:hypothetical protein [Nocardia acididurans]MBL1078098.1 hypothetical protein [Nocardia acididurans]
MNKIGKLAFAATAAAAITTTGAGLASADVVTETKPVVAPGEPNPSGTGSSTLLGEALGELVHKLLLATGSYDGH